LSVLAIYDAVKAAKTADIAGAMAYESLRATIKACDPRLHSVKKHIEQIRTARNILKILQDSEIANKYKDTKLQDAYALRCIPQMPGAAKRVLNNALTTIYDEMLSCSDNPIIYHKDHKDEDSVALMGCNFDGSFVGLQADSICIAIATLAKMSEIRLDRMVNHHFSQLPRFLVIKPGLNNGFMIPQYTAAGLMGEIKVLSHPSTVDSIPTSANHEDPVSMAYYAAKKCNEVVKKLEYILAIELMAACQALDFLAPLTPSSATKSVYDLIRRRVPTLEKDRFMYPDIMNIYDLIHEGDVVKATENIIGKLEF